MPPCLHLCDEVLLLDVVGVGGPLALPEAAERAPDLADVGEVDVAVDDERHGLAGQPLAELVGGGAHVLDHLGTALGKERGQLLLRQALVVARLLDRGWNEVGPDRDVLPAAGSPPRDERPELQLDHVEHTLCHPVRVDVLRIDAKPLRERVSLRREPLSDLVRTREGLLGGDVVPVRGQAAEVGRAALHELEPPVGEVRRDLDADIRHQPPGLGDQPLHVVDRHRGRPVG
jgi:hypothetical protein